MLVATGRGLSRLVATGRTSSIYAMCLSTDAGEIRYFSPNACVPTNRSIHSQGDGTLFGRSAFVYQPEADTYRCPAGHVLARKQEVLRRDRLILYAARDCTGCSLKPRCTTAERRFVSRHLHEEALERMNTRFQADPNLIRQRRCASEHPFGTIKRMTAGGRFLTRGLRGRFETGCQACSSSSSALASFRSSVSKPSANQP